MLWKREKERVSRNISYTEEHGDDFPQWKKSKTKFLNVNFYLCYKLSICLQGKLDLWTSLLDKKNIFKQAQKGFLLHYHATVNRSISTGSPEDRKLFAFRMETEQSIIKLSCFRCSLIDPLFFPRHWGVKTFAKSGRDKDWIIDM